LTGGEDDLVQVWSMEDRKIVAWGEGHNSWVKIWLYYPSGVLHQLPSDILIIICRLVELLLIPIGHLQVLMKQGKMLCIGSVLLVR